MVHFSRELWIFLSSRDASHLHDCRLACFALYDARWNFRSVSHVSCGTFTILLKISLLLNRHSHSGTKSLCLDAGKLVCMVRRSYRAASFECTHISSTVRSIEFPESLSNDVACGHESCVHASRSSQCTIDAYADSISCHLSNRSSCVHVLLKTQFLEKCSQCCCTCSSGCISGSVLHVDSLERGISVSEISLDIVSKYNIERHNEDRNVGIATLD